MQEKVQLLLGFWLDMKHIFLKLDKKLNKG